MTPFPLLKNQNCQKLKIRNWKSDNPNNKIQQITNKHKLDTQLSIHTHSKLTFISIHSIHILPIPFLSTNKLSSCSVLASIERGELWLIFTLIHIVFDTSLRHYQQKQPLIITTWTWKRATAQRWEQKCNKPQKLKTPRPKCPSQNIPPPNIPHLSKHTPFKTHLSPPPHNPPHPPLRPTL